MTLSEAISSMQLQPSPEANRAFSDLFRSMCEENTQVYTVAQPSGSGYAIATRAHFGNSYCLFFSGPETVEKPEGMKTCRIGLSDLIHAVYKNPHLSGIVIDPDANLPVFIQCKDLQVISGILDPRLQKRDWGKGIPDYTESDILAAEEALELAMEIVAKDALGPGNYTLLDTNNGLTSFPNFIAEKDHQTYYIAVDVAVAPKIPQLQDDVRQKILSIAAENGAKLLYAPVSIASADPERMLHSLCLAGDSFVGNFAGLIELKGNDIHA